MFKKIIPVMLCMPLLFTAGCEKDATDSSAGKPAERVFANLEDSYILLSQAVVPSTLPEITENASFPASVTGEGVLYEDVSSSISITVNDYELDIQVDGQTCSIYEESFLGANIVDLDTRDTFHELAVYGEGASADPYVHFIRYDGEKLYPLCYASDPKVNGIYGYFHADETDVYPTYGAIWTNQKGSVVTSFGQIGFTKPRIALERFALENGEWKRYDYTPDIVGTVTVAQDFKAYFTPETEAPASYEDIKYMQNFAPEKQRAFQKGQEIIILDYGKMYSYYAFYIEVDGETGVIAFWIGD